MSSLPLLLSGFPHPLQAADNTAESKTGRMLVIWNDGSSQGSQHHEMLQELVELPHVDVCAIAELDGLLTCEPDRREYAVIVAAGGDGTIHAVANELLQMERPTPLAILPLGTGNDLCRSLEIPADPAAVCQAILRADWEPRQMDAVEMTIDGERRFMINLLSAGISASVTQKIADEYKETFGSFAYLTGMFQAFSETQDYRLEYQLDGGPTLGKKCLNFFIANGRMCGGGIEVSPRSQLDDGQLEWITYLPMTGVDRAKLMTDYLIGRYEEHPAVEIETFRELTLHAPQKIPISLDGELSECQHITARLATNKLTVLIPRLPQNTPETPTEPPAAEGTE